MTDTLSAVLSDVVAALGGQPRQGQQQMAAEVAATLDGNKRLLVQAGTGTGKSMAYLLPTLLHVAATRKRAVISTATLALQRQVLGIDVPIALDAVRKATGKAPTVALLKGWNNYICKHKLTGGYPSEGLFDLPDTTDASSKSTDHDAPASSKLGDEVLRLREFAAESETGDRDDLLPGVSDRAWRQASISKLECLGQRCPLFEECFPEAARKAATEADVVVTNHAMLGVVASGNSGALPEHDLLVIDEAHELPSRVTNQATEEVSAATVERVARTVRRNAGVPTTSLDEAAGYLRDALIHAPAGRWNRGLPLEVNAAIRDISEATRALLTALKKEKKGEPDSGAHVARSELVQLQEITDRLLDDAVTAGTDVVWLDPPRRPGDGPRVFVAPLEVAGKIATNLMQDKAIVATSATLALGGSFDHVANSMGFFDNYTATEVGSPFDYPSQAILYVAKHLDPPGRDGLSAGTLDEIAELITAAGGRTLGLFSSRRAAEEAAAKMRERLDVPILLQGEDGLPALVAAFRADPRACLFGTLSLWQGIDAPGDTCQLVLIDRVPFPRPDDPIMSARTDAVARRGGNGFMAVSATHAALLLAQGAGRLIRRVDDRGVVAILDSRVATKRYGSYLRKSLPPFYEMDDAVGVREALVRLDAAASSAAASSAEAAVR